MSTRPVSASRIRILTVDDPPLILEGFANVLHRQPDMELVGEASDGYGAIEAFAKLRPDVALIDLQTPGMNGIETISAILEKWPGARCVVLTTVHSGKSRIPAEIASELASHLASDALSEREIQVLRMVREGCSNKVVADRLKISEDTVKGHMRSILSKLNANDRTHAVMIAVRRGFIEG
jgi:DNA-binding NarL/FixJ family response regulator